MGVEGRRLAHVADPEDVLRREAAGEAGAQRHCEAGTQRGAFELYEMHFRVLPFLSLQANLPAPWRRVLPP